MSATLTGLSFGNTQGRLDNDDKFQLHLQTVLDVAKNNPPGMPPDRSCFQL
jgi:hypothetical protein